MKQSQKQEGFYRHYITAAAHRETLAYFPPHSDLLYSSRVGGGGGLCSPNAARREELGEGRSRSSHSEPVVNKAGVYIRLKGRSPYQNHSFTKHFSFHIMF